MRSNKGIRTRHISYGFVSFINLLKLRHKNNLYRIDQELAEAKWELTQFEQMLAELKEQARNWYENESPWEQEQRWPMLVTGDNSLQLFLGLEGVGLASYLLIHF